VGRVAFQPIPADPQISAASSAHLLNPLGLSAAGSRYSVGSGFRRGQGQGNLVRSKVRWGVLGVASIAVRKVIPAMQKGEWSEVVAIASRDRHKAEAAAGKFGIARAYGSYEDLLRDAEVEAIYNPLPNHLHVPWTLKAIESGKHVLCEKPLSLTADEARTLLPARDRAGVKVGEAFMVRTHPQWLGTRAIIDSARIGELRSIVGFFSYFERDAANVRSVPEWGGGGLLDIGCYPITISRFIFRHEPARVLGLIERDPDLKIDRLTSAILDFPSGQSTFTCSTQLVYHQRMHFFGTRGRIEVEIPFNAPSDRPCRIFIDDGRDLFGGGMSTQEFATCNQYTIQGDVFSRAIREGGDVPVSLEDAIKNMSVIDAVFRSAESGKWEIP
jgi:predicted dehydrogenase